MALLGPPSGSTNHQITCDHINMPPLHRRLAHILSIGLFVVLVALLGGMMVPFLTWILTATLVPDVLTWPLILVGLAGGAWLGRVISEDWDWFVEE